MGHRWQSLERLARIAFSGVTSIIQTHGGYLWFGTQEGLVRFNGLHFTVLDERTSPALVGEQIHALCEARDGPPWIGTDTGAWWLSKTAGPEFTARPPGWPATRFLRSWKIVRAILASELASGLSATVRA